MGGRAAAPSRNNSATFHAAPAAAAGVATAACTASVVSQHSDRTSPGGAVLRAGAEHSPMDVLEDLEGEDINREPKSQAAIYDSKTLVVLLAGGLAGCVSKTVTAPLARLTILYQVQTTNAVPGWNPARQFGVVEAAARIVRNEGVLALWKGNGVTILHRLPYSAINFFTYERLLLALSADRPLRNRDDTSATAVAHRLLAGGGSGLTSCALTYPLDLIRTRLSAQTTVKVYRGVGHALRTIYHTDGPLGLYRGMGATLLSVAPNLAINFAAYETLRSRWRQMQPDVSPVTISLGAGSVAGMTSALLTFPLDLVRRRMQMPGGEVPKGYSRALTTARAVYRSDGIWGFYRGIVPELGKVVPGVAIAFGTYEWLKKRLGAE